MDLTWDTFRFPFNDPRWKGKAAIGSLLAMVGMSLWLLSWPLLLPVLGYGVRVMRSSLRGEPPSLPEWDEWGQLFRDGLRALAVGFVYYLPALLVMCAGYALLFAMVIPIAATEGDGEGPMLGMIILSQVAFLLTFGISFVLGLPLSFLGLIGLARMVASDSLGSAFEFRAVWALARHGFGKFAVAYVILVGTYMLMYLAASLLVYTIVLCILMPLAYGFMLYYTAVLGGALFGKAYHLTQANTPLATP
jgi:hypothetical protein